MPSTPGEDPPEKKIALRNKIEEQIRGRLDEYRTLCRGRSLSLDITFYLSREKEKGSPRDLDNMLKVLGDTLQDHIDGNRNEPGLGLIKGISDHAIQRRRRRH
jgi:hypothetical protein